MTARLCGPAGSLVRFSHAVRRVATTRALLASSVLWLILEILIMGRPFGIAQLREITGGPTILDMTFTTSPQQVYAVLDALGEAGRAFDLTRIVPLDLVFPFTYALFLSVAISWALARWLPQESPWTLLNLAPVIAATADYCENAGIVTLLLTYPARLDPVALCVSAMYVIKFAFSALSFAVLFAALAGWAVTAVKSRSGRRTA
ncbi:MAG: hypothetical protein LUQ19_03960 [Methanoregula sp.]|nr:hypothetical protein [Methanoregula sp.]